MVELADLYTANCAHAKSDTFICSPRKKKKEQAICGSRLTFFPSTGHKTKKKQEKQPERRNLWTNAVIGALVLCSSFS